MPADAAKLITSSYELVLQSKGLLLQRLLRVMSTQSSPELEARAARLESDIRRVRMTRARLGIQFADTVDATFWIDVYSLLIQQGENMVRALRAEEPEEGPPAAELTGVDGPLIDHHLVLWRRRLHDWMLAASA
jgi:hypothetical protein